jgi:hypothetical protein
MSASPDELAATAARDFARTLAARRLVEGEHVAPARPMLDEVRSYLAGAAVRELGDGRRGARCKHRAQSEGPQILSISTSR